MHALWKNQTSNWGLFIFTKYDGEEIFSNLFSLSHGLKSASFPLSCSWPHLAKNSQVSPDVTERRRTRSTNYSEPITISYYFTQAHVHLLKPQLQAILNKLNMYQCLKFFLTWTTLISVGLAISFSPFENKFIHFRKCTRDSKTP